MIHALTKIGVTPFHCSLGSDVKRLKVGKPQTGHPANDAVRFPMLALLLSIVWGSSADNPDVNIQWTQCGVQNDD